ncbi:hypothetical protein J1N35_041966 [Gossypium stocksii]|uniref:RNase H type-1 domain-containing protein n=1 Tax=Gossypium stocksii TaxID=47602 RepID=A0A9D3UIG1_9ROSI|nr:hypothetical protein J1N35_041966 [Gossypium stocksii]
MEGVVRGIFPGVVATNVAEEAEIGAVKVALEVFLAMNWKTNDTLFIDLDSLVVSSWYVNKVLRTWSLHAIFSDIEITKLNSNDMAFSLAMAGVNWLQVFKAWW